jgi:murein DD-endopeptidase MepM/ murein hydrolase activator NlpD
MPLARPAPAGRSEGEADDARLHRAARALEALVLKQLVTASKAFGGGEGAGSAIRADLFADTLAGALADRGGIGLARQLEASLQGGRGAAPAPAPAPFPVPGTPGFPAVTSAFGPRQDPIDGHLARHEGVDLAAAEGAEVRALAPGVVRRAGARGGYGQAVEIDHGGGLTTVYAHASALLVEEGQAVGAGQPIARAGQTGRATGPHLHLEVRLSGAPVDPVRALKIYGLRADDLVGGGS